VLFTEVCTRTPAGLEGTLAAELRVRVYVGSILHGVPREPEPPAGPATRDRPAVDQEREFIARRQAEIGPEARFSNLLV
jgi:hypothetical protein